MAILVEVEPHPLNEIGVDGTHGGEVGKIRNGDGKMVKDPHDSRRKDELITGHCILIDIKDRSDEVRGEVYERSSKRDKRKQARGSVIEL